MVASLVSGLIVLRHRRPKSLEAGIESFSRELKALAPERRPAAGRDARSGSDGERSTQRRRLRARPVVRNGARRAEPPGPDPDEEPVGVLDVGTTGDDTTVSETDHDDDRDVESGSLEGRHFPAVTAGESAQSNQSGDRPVRGEGG